MKSYLTEFVGTFFLVLTIGLTVVAGSPLAPLAIGAALMVMVYMGGHVSGAHYNPAVSMAVMLLGRIKPGEFAAYVVAQVLGALTASFAVHGITGQTFAPAPGPGIGALAALLVELLFTFALALVVLNAAASVQTKGNSFYGLAIGFTIMAAAAAGGPVSGGAFNPAVGIGPTLIQAVLRGGTVAHLWLYIVGPAAGAALAAGMFRVQEPAA
jgi:aquaporin Z